MIAFQVSLNLNPVKEILKKSMLDLVSGKLLPGKLLSNSLQENSRFFIFKYDFNVKTAFIFSNKNHGLLKKNFL